MSVEDSATPQSIICRRCMRCDTLMTPARYETRTGMPERLRLPGPHGGEAIRLLCENGHLAVLLVRDLSPSDNGDVV